MEVRYFDVHIEIWIIRPVISGTIFPDQLVCRLDKLADLTNEIESKLSDEQLDQIWYFFFDLITQ